MNSLDLYLKEIKRYSLLSREDEIMLAKRVQRGDLQARQEMVNSNLRFVVTVANKYTGYGFQLLDLIQEGNLGLMHAVKNFDPSRGFRLTTYSMWWIRSYIGRFVTNARSLVKIMANQPQRMANKDFSLNTIIYDNNHTSQTYQDMIPGKVPTIDNVNAKAERDGMVRARVWRAMQDYNDKERYIIMRRLMNTNPKTLTEIGEIFSISRERARQIEARVLEKLHKIFKPTELRPEV
jgi:RNA polymerase sigma factor (sigma-70 family)